MGRRGKAPAPTAIKMARGGPNRVTGIVEPAPESGEPLCPRGLSGTPLEIWRSLIPVVGRGVLTTDNGETLARYCHGLARWWKLAEWLDENDDTYTVTDQQLNIRHLRHPNVITYEKLGRDLMRMEQEFGLTPSSRTRVHSLIKPPAAKPAPIAHPALKIAN